MFIWKIGFLIVSYAAILELNDKDFKKAVDSNPYLLVEFYSPNCKHCKKFEPIYEQVAKDVSNITELRLARIDATKHKDYAKALNVQKFPTFFFFRLTDREDYELQHDREIMSAWLRENSRPLLIICESTTYLEYLLKDKQAVVFFDLIGQNTDSNIINGLKKVSKRLSNIPFIRVIQPQVRTDFGIPDDVKLILYNVDNSQHYKGPLQGLELWIMEHGFDKVFTGTESELQVLPLQAYQTVILLGKKHNYMDLAQNYNKIIRFVILNEKNTQAIEYFKKLLNISEFKKDDAYFYNWQQKKGKKITNIEESIELYLDQDL